MDHALCKIWANLIRYKCNPTACNSPAQPVAAAALKRDQGTEGGQAAPQISLVMNFVHPAEQFLLDCIAVSSMSTLQSASTAP